MGEMHTVETRLEFAKTLLPDLPEGFHIDVRIVDNDSPIEWTRTPYSLFAATGPWDESGARAALDALSAWIASVLPDAERIQAGLTTDDVELTLGPDGDGWTIIDRY